MPGLDHYFVQIFIPSLVIFHSMATIDLHCIRTRNPSRRALSGARRRGLRNTSGHLSTPRLWHLNIQTHACIHKVNVRTQSVPITKLRDQDASSGCFLLDKTKTQKQHWNSNGWPPKPFGSNGHEGFYNRLMIYDPVLYLCPLIRCIEGTNVFVLEGDVNDCYDLSRHTNTVCVA